MAQLEGPRLHAARDDDGMVTLRKSVKYEGRDWRLTILLVVCIICWTVAHVL